VEVREYFMSLNSQHAKNKWQFATMHVRGFVIDQVNASLHTEINISFSILWQFFTFYSKDAHLHITRVCGNCLLLSKCQSTPGTIGAIQMLGLWLSACTRLCSQINEWLFKKQGSFLSLLIMLPLLDRCSCVPSWWLEVQPHFIDLGATSQWWYNK